jgi:hypothetical protein
MSYVYTCTLFKCPVYALFCYPSMPRKKSAKNTDFSLETALEDLAIIQQINQLVMGDMAGETHAAKSLLAKVSVIDPQAGSSVSVGFVPC